MISGFRIWGLGFRGLSFRGEWLSIEKNAPWSLPRDLGLGTGVFHRYADLRESVETSSDRMAGCLNCEINASVWINDVAFCWYDSHNHAGCRGILQKRRQF